MNIILLSGGGGKRLWPLSNDVRSKQFLKLFRNDSGGYESMVQRICRQIHQVDKSARVVIAAGKAQSDIIQNQLGEEVTICAEPSRRITFSAILLAVSYLHDVCGISEHESVVVCPADAYASNSFFTTILQVESLARQETANIALIGVTPSGPSEWFGHIIPNTLDTVSRVAAFKEKPDTESARMYIR